MKARTCRRLMPSDPATRSTCARCGEPSVRQVGIDWLCDLHAEAILEPIRRKVIEPERIGGGIGRRAGPLDASGWCLLVCDNVPNHTWVGPPGEGCSYCDQFEELNRRWNAERLLEPPDVNRADINYQARMGAWRERVARGVVAGIVSNDEAWRAVNRASR